jgi:hypothetical protein
VNLRGFDPSGAVMSPGMRSALSGDLGVALQRIPGDFGAQASLYRSMLNVKRILVLLDNARDIEQVRPFADYQDAINYRGATIDPGGCAPVCREYSVDLISQTSICGRASHLADDNPRPPSRASAKNSCLSLVPITQETKREERRPPNCLRRS